jgi:hypothetical protein
MIVLPFMVLMIVMAAIVFQSRFFTADNVSKEPPARRQPQKRPVAVVDASPKECPADIAVPSPAQKAMQAFFDNPRPLADHEAALRRIALMWDKSYTDDGTPVCERAGDYGLKCFRDKGSWEDLRKYRLRAVIILSDAQGGRHPAIVSHLDETRVRLSTQAAAGVFNTADVSQFWNGEFTLLWKKPTELESLPIKYGSRGSGVVWLRHQLDAISGCVSTTGESAGRAPLGQAPLGQTPLGQAPLGQTPLGQAPLGQTPLGRAPLGQALDGSDPELFDKALTARVQSFQRSHLVPDYGIVGPVTTILLTTELKNTAAPLLKKP